MAIIKGTVTRMGADPKSGSYHSDEEDIFVYSVAKRTEAGAEAGVTLSFKLLHARGLSKVLVEIPIDQIPVLMSEIGKCAAEVAQLVPPKRRPKRVKGGSTYISFLQRMSEKSDRTT